MPWPPKLTGLPELVDDDGTVGLALPLGEDKDGPEFDTSPEDALDCPDELNAVFGALLDEAKVALLSENAVDPVPDVLLVPVVVAEIEGTDGLDEGDDGSVCEAAFGFAEVKDGAEALFCMPEGPTPELGTSTGDLEVEISGAADNVWAVTEMPDCPVTLKPGERVSLDALKVPLVYTVTVNGGGK